jgi:hypothetical protein
MVNANMISNYRAAVVAMLGAAKDCRDLELQILSQGGAAAFQAGDFAGANADLNITTLTAVFTSRTAVETLCAANGNAHYTNLMKARA